MRNFLKNKSKLILLFICLISLTNKFKALNPCSDPFTINTVDDQRLSQGKIFVTYSYTNPNTLSSVTPYCDLPPGYVVNNFNPTTIGSFPGTYTGLLLEIDVTTGSLTDPFSFIIHTGYPESPCSGIGNVEENCDNCQGSFAPLAGGKYILSAWVKEDTPTQVETYTGPTIEIDFGSGATAYTASNKIIEGWQKIEDVFVMPSSVTLMMIRLKNTGTNDVYYDDIRIHPFNSSMKSYVYDPVSLRLWAELDENNYATFYQYDEEGKLIRIKKETERGVETIQESRESKFKQDKSNWNSKLKDNDSSN